MDKHREVPVKDEEVPVNVSTVKNMTIGHKSVPIMRAEGKRTEVR